MPKAKLTVIAERADPDIVRFLETLLEQAKKGQLRSVAVATADKGGRINSDSIIWSQDRAGIYMAVEKLKALIIERA